MKLSISLPEEDIQTALRLLHTSELADDYASAWAEMDEEEDRTWDRSSADGLAP